MDDFQVELNRFLTRFRAFWRGVSPQARRFIIGCVVAIVAAMSIRAIFGFNILCFGWFSVFPIFLFGGWFSRMATGRRSNWSFIRDLNNQVEQWIDPQRGSAIDDDLGTIPPIRNSPGTEKPKGNPAGRSAADRAVRMAGFDPAALNVRLNDIGLTLYAGSNRPVALTRDDAATGGRIGVTHMRPFIRVVNPFPREATQAITFEINDESGNTPFSSSQTYTLAPGENFIAPQNRLSTPPQNPAGKWTLTVRLGETPLAVHRFGWHEQPAPTAPDPVQEQELRDIPLQSDGEISEPSQSAVRRLATDMPLSLEELLSDQTPPDRTTRSDKAN